MRLARIAGPGAAARFTAALLAVLSSTTASSMAAADPAAPSPPPASVPVTLEHTSWKLVELNAQPVAASKAEIVLDPTDHHVSGSTGCNRIAGSYELNGESIHFGPLAMTMMACVPDELMKLEQTFVKALATVQAWKMDGAHLALLDAQGKVVAQFDATPPVSLEHTSWHLVELRAKPVAENEDAPNKAEIVLDQTEHRVSGSAGCNRIMGGYELKGDSLHFGPLGMTMMACAPELMKQEQTFVKALADVAAWKIDGTQLDLLDAKGEVVARFVAAPATTEPSPSPAKGSRL
jgi:heat shock protein HslJ